MTDTKQQAVNVPEFGSYEEEATWWDNHRHLNFRDPDAPTYKSKGNPNAKSIYLAKDPLEGSMNIRFSEQDLEKIRAIANKKGIGPTTLVRMWAKERLQQEQVASSR